MICEMNVPFSEVPRELIEQFNNCPFSYDEYLDVCVLYDAFPMYWNLAFYEDDEMIAFVWGMFDLLDKFVHIIRFSVLPEARMGKEHRIKEVIPCLAEVAKYYGAKNMFFISDKPDVFTSKAPQEIGFSQSYVMEVSLNENLH